MEPMAQLEAIAQHNRAVEYGQMIDKVDDNTGVCHHRRHVMDPTYRLKSERDPKWVQYDLRAIARKLAGGKK